MRKCLFRIGVFVLAVVFALTLIVPSACKKGIKSSELSHSSPSADHIQRVQRWFYENWQKPASANASSSRVSPWLHDTNFIINNYANIVLDWRFARVINQG